MLTRRPCLGLAFGSAACWEIDLRVKGPKLMSATETKLTKRRYDTNKTVMMKVSNPRKIIKKLSQ